MMLEISSPAQYYISKTNVDVFMYNTHYHLSYSLLLVDRKTADKFSDSDLVKNSEYLMNQSIGHT